MIDDRQYEELLLALCIWRESRGEPYEGQLAVAHCVRNRVLNPKWWGSSYYSVVTKKWQFSSMTDPRDRQLTMFPDPGDERWHTARMIAANVMEGLSSHPMPGADSYYADYIDPPKWATDDKRVGVIGHHVFYNIDEDTLD